MISMWWGLVILYSRYHIILLPQCWWRLVILLSCYRIILPSLTTSSYRLRTGCHCSILPSLVNIALGSKARKNCEWWLLVFAVCLFYHVPSYCILPYEALDKVFKIKMHWWPHRTKVPKKRGCGEKKASVLCGANLLLAKSSKAAALSFFLLGILWHYALKVVGNVFCGRGTQAGAQFAFNLFNVFSPHWLSNLSLARKCGICFCLKMDILLLLVNIMMIIIMRTITGV